MNQAVKTGLFLSVAACVQVNAGALYVDINGSDDNIGTSGSPVYTLQRASSLAKPGDTVYVRKGTYKYTSMQNIFEGGTAEKKVVYRPYGSDQVTFSGEAIASDPIAIIAMGTGTRHVVFRGFEVCKIKGNADWQGTGISMWGASYIDVIGCYVHNCWGAGIRTGYEKDMSICRDILIDSNIVHDCCENSITHDLSHIWAQGIGGGIYKNVVISNNKCYNNHDEGIGVYEADSVRVVGNICYDNNSVNVYFDNVTNSVVDRNFVYRTNDPRFAGFYFYLNEPPWNRDVPHSCIAFANETWRSIQNPCRNNVITNNIVVGGYSCFQYGSWQEGGGLKDHLIANNTFVNGLTCVVKMEIGTHTGTKFINNVFLKTPGTYQYKGDTEVPESLLVYFKDANELTFQNNVWYGGNTKNAPSGQILKDPKLKNAGSTNFDAANYVPLAGTACLDAGVAVASVNTDYARAKRPQGNAYDVGAYELASGSTFSIPAMKQKMEARRTVSIKAEGTNALCITSNQFMRAQLSLTRLNGQTSILSRNVDLRSGESRVSIPCAPGVALVHISSGDVDITQRVLFR